MKNRPQREQDAAGRADPLFAFLGGDDLALRIFRALRRDERNWGNAWTVEKLHDQLNWELPEVHGLGPVALNRVREKLAESG